MLRIKVNKKGMRASGSGGCSSAGRGRFTPCAGPDSLLVAVIEAARNAVSGAVALPSLAGSSFIQFRNKPLLAFAVIQLVGAIWWLAPMEATKQWSARKPSANTTEI